MQTYGNAYRLSSPKETSRERSKMAMQPRATQLGPCENPASLRRQHGSRLAANPSRESTRADEYSQDENKGPSSQSRATTVELSLSEASNGTTVEERTNPTRLLSVREVAALLHVPVSWVYGRMRKRSRERLPAYRLGKYWRFRETEIFAWLQSQDESRSVV